MNLTNTKRLVIVGGVAAGAYCAARARRLDESAQITLLERGPDVSLANCGLPYFIGGEITHRQAPAVQTPPSLKAMPALDVRASTEVIAIDRPGIPDDPLVQVVDTRPAALVQAHPLTQVSSVNIPLAALRQRLGELDHSRLVVTVCAFGKTAYFAARFLAQNGFQV